MDEDGVYLVEMRRYSSGAASELPPITQYDRTLIALDSMARRARGGDSKFDDLLLVRSDYSHAGDPRSEDRQLGYDVVANIVLTPACMPPGRSLWLCCMNCASC
jgi:hypothetical protein